MLEHNCLLSAFAVFALLALPVPALGETAAAPVTTFGVAFKPLDAKLSKNRRTVRITKPFPEDNPRYYRLRVKVDNPQREDWTISVRSPVGQVLSTFDQSETGCEDAAGCWTARLSSKLPTVQFATESDVVKAEIVGALYMPDEAKHPFYSPMPNSKDESLTAMSGSADEKQAVYELADTLGLFIGSGNAADGSMTNWCCSGVRLTGGLFMTNWHCGAPTGMGDAAYWPESGADNVCRAGIVDMSWDEDGVGREFSCEKVEYANKDLDVAILRLGKLADGIGLSRPLRTPGFSTDEIRAGDDVMVLHHPACKPKSVTRGCTILKPEIRSWTTAAGATGAMTEFTHNCTTEAGSSGGPVFSSDNRLIGLHHLGADSAGLEAGNFAVGMASIMEQLRTEAAGLHREITGSDR